MTDMEAIKVKVTVTKSLLQPMMKDSADLLGKISLEIQNIPNEQEPNGMVFLFGQYMCKEKLMELSFKPYKD